MPTRRPIPSARQRRAGTAQAPSKTAADLPVLPFAPEEFRERLRAWFREHARALPWRGIRDPYATWLSEIMLQQTRVATVIERYREFLIQYPTLRALAEADEAEVLALWSGLGYYRRARMLHRGAQFVMKELDGKLPRTAAELRSLPGIGDYTASAVASIAFGESVAVMDGNVERVLLRVLGLPEDRSGKGRAHLSSVAGRLVPPAASRTARSNPPGDHNQAMMELGATICLPRSPLCLQCPVVDFCQTRGEHRTAERGKPQSRQVAYLLALRKRGAATEVLLERRAATASLMPGMLELPPLPLDAVLQREPALRLRHSITNTNYYVEIYAEGATGAAPLDPAPDPFAEDDQGWPDTLRAACPADPETASDRSAAARLAELLGEVVEGPVFGPGDERSEASGVSSPSGSMANALRAAIPAAEADLQWMSLSTMYSQPLTGLTRKCLQRLRLMPIRQIRLS